MAAESVHSFTMEEIHEMLAEHHGPEQYAALKKAERLPATLHNCTYWYSFYSLLRPANGLKLELNVADTVLLNADGLPTSWFLTSKTGHVATAPAGRMSFQSIRDRFVERAQDNADHFVAVTRSERDTWRVLGLEDFDALVASVCLFLATFRRMPTANAEG